MDEPDLRAEKKADLGRSSGELIQDHLGRCHKSVQPLPPHPPPPTDTLKDSRRKASILALCLRHQRIPNRLSINICALIAVRNCDKAFCATT